LVKATEQMMRVVRDLEKKRLTLMNVGTDSSVPQPIPQLSTILKDFDKQTADKAVELKDQMLSIVEDLGETNKTNAELLRRNIGYINFLFNAIMRDESPVYGQKPNPQGVNPKLFDGRA
ncbi:MAG: flagellar export chaperone FlgN, partial [Candidatus Aquicultor sp.]